MLKLNVCCNMHVNLISMQNNGVTLINILIHDYIINTYYVHVHFNMKEIVIV